MNSKKCDHDHDHTHHHHQHGEHFDFDNEMRAPDTIFKIGITLNLTFALAEIYCGYWVQSLSLISDAFHNLTDVFGLLVAWLGYHLTKKSKSKKYSLYAAFVNSSLLIVGSLFIIKEAIDRLQNPGLPLAKVMIGVSFIGFLINFVSAKLFHVSHHHDLNMKSAYLHLMADAGISLGVTLAGILIYFFSINWIDPVFSVLISIFILISTWKVLLESYRQIKLN